ncbi:MAG TPA: creatininase family protein [Thermoplasmata archaeon]|nr:creatininase family protein [Thermoplasmata archaeon]
MPRPTYRLWELDSRTYERRLSSHPLVIVPVGALEAHGPHLPLGADQIQAEQTALALAERVDALVAPTIPYGSAPGARRFPGTVSLTMAQLEAHVAGVLQELARGGVRRLLVLSGHGERGHMAALREASDDTMRSYPGVRVVVLCDYDFVYELRGKESPPTDGHAGLLETSRVLALAPETVGSERPVVEYRHSPFVPGSPTPSDWPESVIGDTRPASAELGGRVQAYVLDRLTETVRALLPP